MGKVVAFADLDGDSDLDLLEAPPTGELLVRSNDGAGTFTSFAATAWRSGTNQDWIGIADTDGDGDLDVIAPSWDQGGAIDVWINDGSARFRGGSTLDFSRRVPGVIASGDLDGDGLADAVTLAGGEAIGIARNDGTGVLVDRPLTVQVRTTAAALFDADGDGDQDLLLVAGSSAFQVQPRLFENDGAGGFIERTQAQMPARSTEGRAVHVADQDADGDLDVLIVGRPSLLLENVGGGRFVDRSFVRLPDPGFAIQCAAWGDVDGDGAADLVVHGTAAGGGRATTELWRNVGLRGFAAVPGAFDASPPWAEDVLLVDIDRDGDLDCVLGGAFDDGVWINDGAQRFVAAAAFIDFRPGTVLDLTLADVDDDGTDELLARVRRSLTQPHRLVYDLRIFRNVGGAYAEDLDAAIRIGAVPAAVFDLDGDGDLDVVEGHRVLTNTTRQLHAPLVPRTGGRARFAFRVLPAGPALALPLIADAALALPLATPFGALRLDPDRMVAAAGPIAFDTEASLDVLVPNDPALTGVTLHVQALLVDPAARARLSSAVAERIVR
jgi:hypothetical protein